MAKPCSVLLQAPTGAAPCTKDMVGAAASRGDFYELQSSTGFIPEGQNRPGRDCRQARNQIQSYICISIPCPQGTQADGSRRWFAVMVNRATMPGRATNTRASRAQVFFIMSN